MDHRELTDEAMKARTLEDYVKVRGFMPTRAQWRFIIAYDKAVGKYDGLLFTGGVASGKTTLLRLLEDYWRERRAQAQEQQSQTPSQL